MRGKRFPSALPLVLVVILVYLSKNTEIRPKRLLRSPIEGKISQNLRVTLERGGGRREEGVYGVGLEGFYYLSGEVGGRPAYRKAVGTYGI
eukprot:437513-Amorphochlora_amoeboformis.AAC.1